MQRRSWANRLFYDSMRALVRFVFVVVFRLRCHGRDQMPPHGPVLVCANHQSYLDPMAVGICFRRRFNFVARKTLFRFAPFRWVIQALGAIPLEREGMGMAGLKESLRRLKQGEVLLIFPEGTRTRDGDVAPLKPGFCMLARRSNVALLPVGIDGAYQAWPRSAILPRLTRVHVVVGEPIAPEWVAQQDDAALVAEVERRIRACHARARAARFR